jgi:hypothetical protein
MIIKGSARGQSAADTSALARHLVARENEKVELLEIQGVTATTLSAALEEMCVVTLGTRARCGLYHASISLDREEAPEMGAARWTEAADELETRLGMTGHQRAHRDARQIRARAHPCRLVPCSSADPQAGKGQPELRKARRHIAVPRSTLEPASGRRRPYKTKRNPSSGCHRHTWRLASPRANRHRCS